MHLQSKPRLPIINRGHPHARGLVACWPFFERGGTTLNDVVSKKFKGAFQTLPATAWITHALGPAVHFTETSSEFIDPGSINICNNKHYTVLAWMRIVNGANPGADQDFFGEDDESGATQQMRCSVQVTANKIQWFQRDDAATNNSVIIGATSLKDSKWHQIACVRNNNLWNIFIDGVDDGDGGDATLGQTTTVNTAIGCLNQNGTPANFFNDDMAELRLYDRALTPKELIDIHAHPWALYRVPSQPKMVDVSISFDRTPPDPPVGNTGSGQVITLPRSTETYGPMTITTDATEIVPSNPGRKGMLLFNNSTKVLYIGPDEFITKTNAIPVLPKATFSNAGQLAAFRGSIYGVVESGEANVRWWEWGG